MAGLRQNRYVRTVVRRLGVHRVVLVVGLLQLPFRRLLEVLVRRLRRDPRLVVFGAPLDRFADNAAYVFCHVAERDDLEAVWVTGSPEVVRRLRAHGLAAELRWSAAGVRACLRAGAYVYSGYRSDINHLLVAGARTVALWHGIGLKRLVEQVGADADRPDGRRGLVARAVAAAAEPPPDRFLSSTGLVTREIFSPAFGVPPERCWELGYPRNDHLVTGREPPPPLVLDRASWTALRDAGRVVGVFLTWRDGRADDVVDTAVLARLAEVAASRGAAVAYKAHYNVAPASGLPDNCVRIPTEADLHAYLGLCDVLVTDYSSISFDFMLTRRPVLYHMPDLDDYLEQRGLYFDPHDVPGRVSRTADQLLAAVRVALDDPAALTKVRDEAFIGSIWGRYDGRASEAVAASLREALIRG